MPAIGEILRAADESFRVINIAAGLNSHMGDIKTSINDKASAFMADSSMPMISTSVRYMGDMIKMMVQNKKRTVFQDNPPMMMHEIFAELRSGQEYTNNLVAKILENEATVKNGGVEVNAKNNNNSSGGLRSRGVKNSANQ